MVLFTSKPQYAMAKNKIALLLFSLFITVFAQAKNNKYIVCFKDKNTNIDIEKTFSQKALEKRKKFNLAFDERDFPVNSMYKNELQKLGISILNESNWLNAVLINADENAMASITNLPFIASVQKINEPLIFNQNIASVIENNDCAETQDVLGYEDTYTSSYIQFHLLNGEYLHEQGFNGENMTIGICDAGFRNANNNPAFSAIFSEGRILGTYDYVHNDHRIFTSTDDAHGAYCFSFIGGLLNNQYIGTSTKSNFYLFQTENNDGGSERLQEEFNLATALQRCDQLGVDVVSISLGYYTFDLASENHDTSDMKKNNTPAAKAVNIAASKNILVCVAAGNEGTSAWHYITTPADADSAFAIAAVDKNGNVAPFSSYGLATDTRVKPNVAAVGWAANFVNTNGTVSSGNGTSFACPSLAGMATCLWQAFPTKTAWQIKTAIEQSASKYLTPDKHVGYGIPDFKKAYQFLSTPTFVSNSKLENEIVLFPNPVKGNLIIQNKSLNNIQSVEIFNNVGQLISTETDFSSSEKIIPVNNIAPGMLLLRILMTNGDVFTKKIIKE
jgi:subtilisin family serine protease